MTRLYFFSSKVESCFIAYDEDLIGNSVMTSTINKMHQFNGITFKTYSNRIPIPFRNSEKIGDKIKLYFGQEDRDSNCKPQPGRAFPGEELRQEHKRGI